MSKNIMKVISQLFRFLFRPKKFMEQEFFEISEKRKAVLGFIGTCSGIAIGSLVTIFVTKFFLLSDFSQNSEGYQETLKLLNLSKSEFSLRLESQLFSSYLLLLCSPLISLLLPHIFGGALYLVVRMLYFAKEGTSLSFEETMSNSRLVLASLFFYCIPLIGSLLSLFFLFRNTNKILGVKKIPGIARIMGIITSIYLTFFVGGITLQAFFQIFYEKL